MKLLHVVDYIDPYGGAEIYLTRLADALSGQGWRNGLLIAKQPPASARPFAFDWIKSSTKTARGDLRLAEEFGPDVVMIGSSSLPDAAERLASRYPTFCYAHDYSLISPGGIRFFQSSETMCEKGFGMQCLYKPYLEKCSSRGPRQLISSLLRVKKWKKVFPKLSGVFCASPFVADWLTQAGVPRVEVVGYFTEPPGWPPQKRSGQDILFLGRIMPIKGVHYLLKAFSRIAGRFPESRLIIGGSMDGSEPKTLAKKLQIADQVDFSGWVSGTEREKMFQRAAMMVIPSLWPEAFGIVGLEAQIRGIPVVAFDVGGISSWLRHGEGGYLVPAKDEKALAGAISMLLSDPGLASSMGGKGAEHVYRNFSKASHVARLQSIFERAAASPLPSPQ